MAADKITIRRRGEDGHKSISLRLPEDLLLAIDQLSYDTNRSRNEIINILLRNAIKIVEISDDDE